MEIDLLSVRSFDEPIVVGSNEPGDAPVIEWQMLLDVAPRFAERPGGYTRIVKLGQRQGDAAEMVYLELVDYEPASAFAAPGA